MRPKRTITDVVVRELQEQDEEWVYLDRMAMWRGIREAGVTRQQLYSACRFLDLEYQAVEFKADPRGVHLGGAASVSRVRLVWANLEFYETGDENSRPGRLHAPQVAWPNERSRTAPHRPEVAGGASTATPPRARAQLPAMSAGQTTGGSR